MSFICLETINRTKHHEQCEQSCCIFNETKLQALVIGCSSCCTVFVSPPIPNLWKWSHVQHLKPCHNANAIGLCSAGPLSTLSFFSCADGQELKVWSLCSRFDPLFFVPSSVNWRDALKATCVKATIQTHLVVMSVQPFGSLSTNRSDGVVVTDVLRKDDQSPNFSPTAGMIQTLSWMRLVAMFLEKAVMNKTNPLMMLRYP